MRLTHLIPQIRSLPIKKNQLSRFLLIQLVKLNSLRVSEISSDVSANLRDDCIKANYDSPARLKEKLNMKRFFWEPGIENRCAYH